MTSNFAFRPAFARLCPIGFLLLALISPALLPAQDTAAKEDAKATAPKETAPKETAPKETAPKETAPDQAAPKASDSKPQASPENKPPTAPETKPKATKPTNPATNGQSLGPAPFWSEKKNTTQALPIVSIEGSRKLLETYGIDESQLRRFEDNAPLSETDREPLIKVLYRLPSFGADRIATWRESPPAWEKMQADPQTYRGRVFTVSGKVVQIEGIALDERQASRLDFGGYYALTLEVAGSDQIVIALVREIPKAWKPGKTISYTASIDGVFLKTGASPDAPQGIDAPAKPDADKAEPDAAAAAASSQPLYFAAVQPAWKPASKEEGVPESWVKLAEWGMDIGQFDTISRRNRKGLGAADREGFYQMLAATKNAPAGELEKLASTEFDLPPLLVDPASQHGKMMYVEGSARKIVRIEVTEADIQKRFGITHYFEIDLLIPLGDQIIKLANGDNDAKAPEYRNHFPATICVLQLPAAWKKYEIQEGAQAGELVHEFVRIPAVYFKLWSYHNEYVSRFSEDQRQPAPLFIGGMPQPVVVERSFNAVTSVLLLLLAVAAVGVFWFGLWRFRGEDSKFKKDTFNKQFEVAEGESLNDMGIQASKGPDFSNLKGK